MEWLRKLAQRNLPHAGDREAARETAERVWEAQHRPISFLLRIYWPVWGSVAAFVASASTVVSCACSCLLGR
jgi:hypothetical protein